MTYQMYQTAFTALSDAERADWRLIPPAVASDCMNRTQSMAAAIKPVAAGMRICGQARTVAAMVGDGGIIQVALAMCRPGEILVIDGGAAEDIALWGAVATRAAQLQQIGGLVLDGAVRDVAEIRESGFPCFCRAVVPRGPHDGFGGIIDGPISAGGVAIRPGDIVLGDDDGIVVVPLARAAAVLKAAQAHLLKEKSWLDGLASGRKLTEILSYPKPEIIRD